ncbi:hypothetical protein [Zooshikella ganghwensis]|uniref:Uncharacterized protein n=1 Tax=Zooshikella ganghwensis TaxID=202772 RepID=A0A4V1IP71_9GAMM|nr:hypothetical protein [Zooshikella ganghwensis]RDH46211.1 hypothetical protein B9G39_23690 [Zooshikella ganghwensis]
MANFGNCPTVEGVQLDNEGRQSLEQIFKVLKYGKALRGVLVGGNLVNALVHDKAAPQAFSVYSTDWGVVAQAVDSVSAIERERIRTISGLQVLRTQGKANAFWKAFNNLCMFSK